MTRRAVRSALGPAEAVQGCQPPSARAMAGRGMAQSGSASALGAEGRGFKSCCPDHFPKKIGAADWPPPRVSEGARESCACGWVPNSAEPAAGESRHPCRAIRGHRGCGRRESTAAGARTSTADICPTSRNSTARSCSRSCRRCAALRTARIVAAAVRGCAVLRARRLERLEGAAPARAQGLPVGQGGSPAFDSKYLDVCILPVTWPFPQPRPGSCTPHLETQRVTHLAKGYGIALAIEALTITASSSKLMSDRRGCLSPNGRFVRSGSMGRVTFTTLPTSRPSAASARCFSRVSSGMLAAMNRELAATDLAAGDECGTVPRRHRPRTPHRPRPEKISSQPLPRHLVQHRSDERACSIGSRRKASSSAPQRP